MFFSITEVAERVGVEKYVVRFWESKFPEVKPDRKQGRRYYRESDIKTLLRIKDLLYKQGFTIAGAKKALRVKGGSAVDVSSFDQSSHGEAEVGREPKLVAAKSRILSRFSFGGADEVEIVACDESRMSDGKRAKIRSKIEEIEKILA
ncbi:MAG: MerR family transcriptional regulator [Alphaproteobacteria bacterium]|nr:MerR family transcriptional regulator [Alphaproteobacteria bacterium]